MTLLLLLRFVLTFLNILTVVISLVLFLLFSSLFYCHSRTSFARSFKIRNWLSLSFSLSLFFSRILIIYPEWKKHDSLCCCCCCFCCWWWWWCDCFSLIVVVVVCVAWIILQFILFDLLCSFRLMLHLLCSHTLSFVLTFFLHSHHHRHHHHKVISSKQAANAT